MLTIFSFPSIAGGSNAVEGGGGESMSVLKVFFASVAVVVVKVTTAGDGT